MASENFRSRSRNCVRGMTVNVITNDRAVLVRVSIPTTLVSHIQHFTRILDRGYMMSKVGVSHATPICCFKCEACSIFSRVLQGPFGAQKNTHGKSKNVNYIHIILHINFFYLLCDVH